MATGAYLDDVTTAKPTPVIAGSGTTVVSTAAAIVTPTASKHTWLLRRRSIARGRRAELVEFEGAEA